MIFNPFKPQNPLEPAMLQPMPKKATAALFSSDRKILSDHRRAESKPRLQEEIREP